MSGTNCFSREVLDGIRFSTELSFAEDYEMFCRVLEQCDTIVCGTKAEYYYMQRKSGICNRGYDRDIPEGNDDV